MSKELKSEEQFYKEGNEFIDTEWVIPPDTEWECGDCGYEFIHDKVPYECPECNGTNIRRA